MVVRWLCVNLDGRANENNSWRRCIPVPVGRKKESNNADTDTVFHYTHVLTAARRTGAPKKTTAPEIDRRKVGCNSMLSDFHAVSCSVGEIKK